MMKKTLYIQEAKFGSKPAEKIKLIFPKGIVPSKVKKIRIEVLA